MRPKVVLAILLAAACVLAVAVTLSKVFRAQPAVEIAPAPVAVSHPHSNFSPLVSVPGPAVEIAPAPATITNHNTNAISPEEHEEYVKNQSDELMDLARQDTPAAIQKIMDALKSPDKAIQGAALNALEQANDRSVVPQMQQIADQTDDPDEKQAIQDAIDFINLPSLSEVMKQRKAQKAAAGNQSPQTPAPVPGQNQPTGPNQ